MDGPKPPPPRRYLAGIALGHVFDEAARAAIEAAGAKVVTYHPRIEVVVLEIADAATFTLPRCLAFLEEDREVGLG